jgi:rare lipoprotein A
MSFMYRIAKVPGPGRTIVCAAWLVVMLSACVSAPPKPVTLGREATAAADGVAARAPAQGPQSSAAQSRIGLPGNPPFYEVEGRRYHVLDDSDGYLERGVASWYGREFHGKRTSNGEIYDMYGLSAAHKTLPLPTMARVTNLANGKSVIVRINDRGPFRKDRVIDMSYAAARDLGMLGAGTTLVEVQALPEGASGAGPLIGSAAPDLPNKAPARQKEPPRMYVQAGAFGQAANAEQLKRQLGEQGMHNVVIRYDARSQPALYRVRVGPIADAREYDAVVDRLGELQIRNPQLVVERADPALNPPARDGGAFPGG